MELPKTFDPTGMDQRWYDRWMEKKLFASKPDDRESYTIVMPPPNVTGVLHMGHALNNTIQDVLIRRARMQGKNACWVPGTDHASIATEAKVVQLLREKGIKKSDLSREEFLKYAWEWKEKYGGIILQQLRKLGCSCDWDRTAFTMDDDYYKSVIQVFIDLYKKGYIYRGAGMVNWDPQAKTALSDEEVIKKKVQSKLYFIRYLLEENGASGDGASPHRGDERGAEYITIATVRPETILGDTAIAVHPKDERYLHLKGRFALVPLINRRIPIIFDEYVEMGFGTGALKVTPAHDKNDYQLGLKYNLEVIDTLNEDGTLNESAQIYIGEDRFVVRKKIVKELEEKGHVVKIEDYENEIGFSERTDAVVEPRLSMQWWCKMSEMAKPSLKAVMDEEIKFYPKKFVNLYRNWMENIRDWCISRQLWWGQRIPAWYLLNGLFEVAETKEQAFEQFSAKSKSERWSEDQIAILVAAKLKDDLRQDDDVLDTWFSSWLWPMEVFHGFSNPDNEDIKYYYPTTTLVTAPEIIFFWVARMIMAGFEFAPRTFLEEPKNWKPFTNVYFTGIVRDTKGRKMSKQLGNSPDLLELIEKYGADAVRFGILISSPAGNDLMYDEKLVEQGRNFNNKIWNALRLVKGWKVEDRKIESGNEFAIQWFERKINSWLAKIEIAFNNFDLYDSLKLTYSLIWDDFCAWYLEMIKPEFEQSIDKMTYEETINFFERLMKILHPFMPFISEEVYQLLRSRDAGDFIMISDYPIASQETRLVDEQSIQDEHVKQIITNIRDLRNRNRIKPKEALKLFTDQMLIEGNAAIIRKLGFINSIESTGYKSDHAISFLVDYDQYFIELPNQIDSSEEKSRLEKDLEYNRGFLESVMKKLSNEKFVANAKPDVIEKENQKANDAKEKIRLLEEQLAKS